MTEVYARMRELNAGWFMCEYGNGKLTKEQAVTEVMTLIAKSHPDVVYVVNQEEIFDFIERKKRYRIDARIALHLNIDLLTGKHYSQREVHYES